MTDDDAEIRITLRLPAKLRDRLEYSAGMNSRSMNGEIVDRLDWSFDRSTKEMQALLDQISERDARIRELEAFVRPPAELSGADLAKTTKLLAEALDQVKKNTRQYVLAMRFLLEELVAQGKLDENGMRLAQRMITETGFLDHDEPDE
ncbi:Arc family DNA-binding protein [Mesorhizobium sp. BE184]|uniref:Arc family DNA-binding protein n=1 Tax=Mesorhizobium sp. BE184 TaxID=2817714 RepID=UPI002864FAB3|nr:Arc family DNA-binding protein [Mesorhizobium sp. BE184]MDR7034520.1 hypothetical protein [Mesorhizobium sp. BE184]